MEPGHPSNTALGAAICDERWRQLVNERRKLESQLEFTRNEGIRVEHDAAKLKAQHKSHDVMVNPASNFIPKALARKDAYDKVTLSIGGQRFEVTRAVLVRDPLSLLAALCSETSPLYDSPEAVAYFDRDWWLFRYILNFLRDGTLPQDPALSRHLYVEASYWELASLQRAIEQNTQQLYRRETGQVGDHPGMLTEKEHEAFLKAAAKAQGRGDCHTNKKPFDKVELPTKGDWWEKSPDWWGPEKEKEKEKEKKETVPHDFEWFTGQKWNGRDFQFATNFKEAPAITDMQKKKEKEMKEAELDDFTHSVWPRQL